MNPRNDQQLLDQQFLGGQDGATEEQFRYETENWRRDPVAQKEYQDYLDSLEGEK